MQKNASDMGLRIALPNGTGGFSEASPHAFAHVREDGQDSHTPPIELHKLKSFKGLRVLVAEVRKSQRSACASNSLSRPAVIWAGILTMRTSHLRNFFSRPRGLMLRGWISLLAASSEKLRSSINHGSSLRTSEQHQSSPLNRIVSKLLGDLAGQQGESAGRHADPSQPGLRLRGRGQRA